MSGQVGDVDDGGGRREALIALAHCVEPADHAVGRLVATIGACEVLRRIQSRTSGLRHEDGIRGRLSATDFVAAERRRRELGVRVITAADAEWPTQLDDLGPLAPFALWVLGPGDLRLALIRSVAMVGARACSAYGEEVARSWSAELADRGWSIVSGGAFGIDAAAHRGALAADGTTVCVLAGGVDMPYPRAHDALIARIGDDGLVLSETPLGESVRRQRFLTRNRLIAAATRATVVIEAAERSGTMATAHAASQMNRVVLAVPGSVFSPTSAGCHRMIRDGTALLVDSATEVLDLLAPGSSPPSPSAVDPRDLLADRERRALDALPTRGGLPIEEWAARAGLSATEMWAALGILEAGGWVRADPRGWRLAATPTSATG